LKITNKFLKRAWIVVIILTVLLVAVYISATNDFVAENTNEDYVCFLDVGQGDSILIKSGEYSALIDTSVAEEGENILKKLRKCGVNDIDVLILTHPHADHIGSTNYLISKLDIGAIVMSESVPEDVGNKNALNDIKHYAERYEIPYYYAEQGMEINVGNFELTVLLTLKNQDDENDNSIVVMAKNNDNKFLFMGDAETPVEKRLIEENINFDCDVLKVGHHGSNSSSSKTFLDIATPQYAVISVGSDNNYGHPHADVLSRLDIANAIVYRTDMQRDILFYIVENQISVKVG